MSRERRSQQNNGTAGGVNDRSGCPIDPKWEELVLTLCGTPAHQPEDLDEMAAAQYLSNECSERDGEHSEENSRESANVNEDLALAWQVLKDVEPAA